MLALCWEDAVLDGGMNADVILPEMKNKKTVSLAKQQEFKRAREFVEGEKKKNATGGTVSISRGFLVLLTCQGNENTTVSKHGAGTEVPIKQQAPSPSKGKGKAKRAQVESPPSMLEDLEMEELEHVLAASCLLLRDYKASPS